MHSFRFRRVIVALAVFFSAMLGHPWVPQSAAQEGAAFQLRPGVIVHPSEQLAYVMNPEGGIDAVELGKGTRVWITQAAAKPLALTGNLLIAQTEPSGSANVLEIVALDTQEGGKRVVAGTLELPAGVHVSIDDSLGRAFAASARVIAGDTLLSWTHSQFYTRGIPPADPQTSGKKALSERETGAPRTSSGTLRLNLNTGAMSSLKAGDVPVSLAQRPPDLARDERLKGVPGVQFLSVDARHVLGSERVDDDRVWAKYRWTIYDHASGERVGEFRNHQSMSSFFVFDSQIVFETGPYLLRTDQGIIDEPLKIRAVDLRTGQELWNRPVRDTAYRGPFPP